MGKNNYKVGISKGVFAMIGIMKNSTLAYAPVLTSSILPLPSEANILASEPSKPVGYSNSITQNTVNLNSSPTEKINNGDGTDSVVDAVQQQAQVQQVINQLKSRDAEVKAHEMAHLAAAGGYSIGGMNFTYQTGPDGRQYAVGGEVGIDTSTVSGNPQATLDKAMIIQLAALAPVEPSSQDRKVASQASQMMVQARGEMEAQAQEVRKAEETKTGERFLSTNDSEDPFDLKSGFFEKGTKMSEIEAETKDRVLLKTQLPSNYAESADRMQFDLRIQLSESRR